MGTSTSHPSTSTRASTKYLIPGKVASPNLTHVVVSESRVYIQNGGMTADGMCRVRISVSHLAKCWPRASWVAERRLVSR